MTARRYLQQAWRLDEKIRADLKEQANLRELTKCISPAGYKEHINSPTRNTEAPFIKSLEKIDEIQMSISKEIERLLALKEQIHEVIVSLEDPNEQMVLHYHYILHMSWEQIRVEMTAGERTVRRWHENALEHIVLPRNPIQI